jgi:hypothetical protein
LDRRLGGPQSRSGRGGGEKNFHPPPGIEPYHMKILLGNLNAKVGTEDNFKPTVGNESLQEVSNDNGVTVINFTM